MNGSQMKAPESIAVDRAQEAQENQQRDSNNPAEGAQSVIDLDADRKSFTTLQARLALAGYALHELSCDGYLITRWNLTKHVPDLRAVGAFLRAIGGAA